MGNVPELRFSEFKKEWSRKKLQDIAKIARGKFTPRPRNDPRFYGGDIPFVQTSDVTNSKGYVSNYTQTLNAEGLKVSKFFHEGTILITIAANIGYCGILKIGMACPDSLIGISCNEDTYNKYLNSYLNYQQPRLDYLAPQAAQKNINIDFLNPYPIPIPELKEQQKIADFLSSVDNKIRLLTEKQSLLQRYKKGVMQKLFSQELRFKDDQGNDFPNWGNLIFSQVIDVIDGDRGSNYPKSKDFFDNEHCLFLNAKNVTKKGFVFNEIKFISRERDLLLRKGKLERFDIVLTTRGSVGHLALYSDAVQFQNIRINSGMVLLRIKDINLSVEYLYTVCNSFIIKKQIDVIAFGSAQPQLTVKEIYKLKLPIPSIKEQQKISNFLNEIDNKIDSVSQQIEQTKTFKKGLLQKMFV